MDEASECDVLMLMREGEMLEETTPDRLRADTGEHDLGRAFLAMIEQARRRRERFMNERAEPMSARVTLATACACCGRSAATRAPWRCCSASRWRCSSLMHFVFDGRPRTFQSIGAPMCGLFPFIIMFLLTSIAMLRERTTARWSG